jgi:hypothetical protein
MAHENPTSVIPNYDSNGKIISVTTNHIYPQGKESRTTNFDTNGNPHSITIKGEGKFINDPRISGVVLKPGDILTWDTP